MNKKKRRALAAVLIIMCLFLCGGILSSASPILDANQNAAYQNMEFEEFWAALNNDTNKVKISYCYMLLGRIVYRDNDRKGIRLGTLRGSDATTYIECKFTSDALKEGQSSLDQMTVGDTVKVYGKLTKDYLRNKWVFVMDKVEKTEQTSAVRTAYSTKSGVTYDVGDMVERKLDGGKITYQIPEKWEAVESNIVDDGLGRIEGYQYRLNEIDQQSIEPESIFVCYFDSSLQLLKSSDKSDTEGIERAIVQNILGKDPGKAVKKLSTYYGASYHYYQEKYAPTGVGYHVEFVFEPVEKRGMIVYLYVYKENAHLDDVILMMRQMRVTK